MNGYSHPDYAKSFKEFGKPICLPQCKGWILKRKIPDFPYDDAMGCYPLFSCENWSELYCDLENNVEDDIVSLSLVADPFGDFDEKYLKRCFKDVVIPFKEHFIVDLNNPINKSVSEHHLRYSRKGLKKLNVEICKNPIIYLDEWESLFSKLIRRHNIKGIRAFSRYVFQKQLIVPGIVAFRAIYKNKTVGMLLCYIQGKIAFSHLSAFSDKGYNLYASYALHLKMIEHFSEIGLKWVDLGAGAGLNKRSNDGLDQFKQGWSTIRKTAYFCGRIFNKSKYFKIVEKKKITDTNYFPVYRKGEF